MTDPRPPLSLFDDATFASVANRSELSVERLREITREHQEGIRELPGVDDIVYEWRNYFHRDPLVSRTGDAYVLAVESHVWDEFADRMDLSPAEFGALKEVHDRQARELVSAADRFDGADALVLTRP